ncbi:DeoR/GlpR family DNA-binding transcription regulator [Enterococcus alishanensis]|uniref:DeoR/GlpR family DNA-binding transcription regulator n=1 Tax=Enterococcus alishanensis TaxID=1303817 RepID=A0ABS6TBR6_9ENTE|nr:DeoR/GlpR family DNA-binding transcription regulator [Enterococcus alishanensis]MBV7390349.1 DeoR/GlpR family DNA-binding transcription regulator [Enterococcus alishanensis]
MLTEERRKKILELLDEHNVVKSQDLMNRLQASESTIRRDLQELEDDGHLKRVHGGATKMQFLDDEPAFSEKSFKNIQQKQAIAKLASQEIDDGDIIYLDAGTTTIELIPYLKDIVVTVVTNSVGLAAKLVEHQINTIVLGGRIKLKTDAVIGSQAMAQLSQYRFDKAFVGTNGISIKTGYTTPDPEEAALKRLAIQQSEKAFILADYSKFNQTTFVQITKLSEAIILTDRCPTELYTDIAKQTTIKEVSV